MILTAAQTEFAAKGFDKTSLRGVAKAAGVDPALVHHYFDSKDDLFLESLGIPFDPREVVPAITQGGVDGLGERIVARFLSIWDDDEARLPLVALVKAASSSEAAADLLRSGLVRMVLTPMSVVIDTDDAALRAQCVASQLLGLAMARYVVRLEPFATTPAAELGPRIGAALQLYIEGPLEGGVDS